jgi:hypothetical protein
MPFLLNKNLFVCGFLFCAVYQPVFSESRRPDTPLFSLESRFLPSIGVKKAPAGLENADIRLHYWESKILLPFRYKNDSTSLTSTLSAESFDIDYLDWNSNIEPTPADHLYGLQLGLSMRRELRKEPWSLYSFLNPGVYSDFKKWSARALRFQGGLIFNYAAHKGTWGLGLVLINNYGTPRVFPAISYMGQLGRDQLLVVRLPVLVSWSRSFSKKTDVGVAARIAGSNYYLSEESRYHGNNLRYSVGLVGPFVKRKLTPRTVVSLDTGTTFRHHLEYFRDGERIKDFDLKNSLYLLLGFKINLF